MSVFRNTTALDIATYVTIILSLSCGYEAWSLTLNDENKLQVLRVNGDFVGCDVVWTYWLVPTLQRNTLPPSSELNMLFQ
jgi:hypothetical protein